MAELEEQKDGTFKPKNRGERSAWEHVPMVGAALHAARTGEDFIEWANRFTSSFTSVDAAKYDTVKAAFMALGAEASKATACKDINVNRLVQSTDFSAYQNAGT